MTRVYFYDAKGHDKTVELSPSLVARTGKQQLIWIDLLRSDEAAVREAAAILKLHDDLTEALLDHPAEPVLESFAGHFHLALPISPNAGKAKDCVTYVVAERWLLTVRDGDIPYFREFRDQDNGETLSGRLTPAALAALAALAAALLDWHLEDYQAEITDIQTNADKIDQDVLLSREEEPPLRVLAKLQARLLICGAGSASIAGSSMVFCAPTLITLPGIRTRNITRHSKGTLIAPTTILIGRER